MRDIKHRQRFASLIAATLVVFASFSSAAAEPAIKKEKLQIVFMLGQSEMVGKAELPGAAYMLDKPLVPPREVTLNAHKAMAHQFNGAYLYWRAMDSYGGPPEKKEALKKLFAERTAFKATFKQQVLDELEKNDGVFRGKKYEKRGGAYRGFWLFNLCDDECEKVGLTPKIRALLEAPDNTFNVEAAYEQLLADSQMRYKKQLELNQLYFNSAVPEDFTAYAQAVKVYEAAAKDVAPQDKRDAIAALAQKHLRLPVVKRTYITAIGTVAGSPVGDSSNAASGKLSVGYGANERSIGLEYAAGIALEQHIDAPVLIVKCAWDSRRGLGDFWRLPGNEGADAPEQQADEPGQAWQQTAAHIKAVLADPGRYHPGYDPKAGYESAGVVWFQGSADKDNPDYAKQLASLLRDLRQTVNTPDLPIVCATVGGMYFKGESDEHAANAGMQAVAAMPGFKGTVNVMDTYLWRPSEVGVLGGLIHKRKIKPDAAMKEALGRAGNGSFYLLAGHEAGARLADLLRRKEK